MTQPDCRYDYTPGDGSEYTGEYTEVQDVPVLQSRNLLPGEWMWIAVFAAVIIFEVWAVWTHHYTMSETVWHGPKWFKWALGLGFLGLLYHLFLQR